MPRYMLNAYDRPMPDLSPAQMQAIIQRYIQWTNRMQATGMLLDGFKLKESEGRCIRKSAAGEMVVTDGPFAESKEVLGGYWMLESPTYEAIAAQLGDHPHLEFGTLELREIDA